MHEVLRALFEGLALADDELDRRVEPVRAALDALTDRVRRAEAERDRAIEREQAWRRDAAAAGWFEDRAIAAISHELRAPLATLRLWNKALRDNPSDATIRARALDAIHESAVVESRLIDDLLDVVRARSGRIELDRGPVAVAQELAAAVEAIRPIAAAKPLALDVRCDPASRMIIDGDAVRIRQVFDKLVSNAVKFTEPGGRVAVTARRTGQAIEIEITDTGPGIRPELLPHVFVPFRRSPTGSAGGSLGVGLAIARALIELHGGALRLTSEGEGRGTTAVVTLPDASPRPAPTAAELRGVRGARVLLVDNDRDMLEALAILLGAAGAEIQMASSSAAAWEAMQRAVPDVVVSDLLMDGGDGIELIRRVRADPTTREVCAVALTARAFPEDRERALAAGFDVHVAKPVDIDELVAILARARASRLALNASARDEEA